MRTVLACAAALVVAGSAAKAETVTNPDWIARPTGADMERFYPFVASTLGLEGKATISCKVEATGKLKDCTTLSESMKGVGFGPAAVKLSRLFRMKAQTVDSRPVEGGVVCIPISFRLPPKPKPQALPEPTPEALALARRLAAPRDPRVDAATQAEMYVNSIRSKLSVDLDPVVAAKAANALRLAHQDMVPRTTDLQARVIATIVPLAELQADTDFWTSDLGRQVSAKVDKTKWEQVATMYGRMLFTLEAARQIFCQAHDCADQDDFATARAPKAAPGLVLKPEWVETPDFTQMSNAHPSAAKMLGIGGHAGLLCERGQSGMLRDCKILAETPAKLGFGAAAMRLAPFYRLSTDEASAVSAVWLVVAFKPIRLPPPVAKVEPATGPNVELAKEVVTLEGESRMKASIAALERGGPFGSLPPPDGSPVGTAARQALLEATRRWEANAADPYVSLYAKAFSETELKGYSAYLRSPAGRLWAERQIAVAATVIELSKSLLSERFMTMARTEFCSKHDCGQLSQADIAQSEPR